MGNTNISRNVRQNITAMKNIQHITTKGAGDSSMSMSNHHGKASKPKSSTGSLAGKYPVILDEGRTIIYISDKSLEQETRKNYESRQNNRLMVFAKKQLV